MFQYKQFTDFLLHLQRRNSPHRKVIFDKRETSLPLLVIDLTRNNCVASLFCDQRKPIGGVVVGANGNVFGTASYSSLANDAGTTFQLAPQQEAAPGPARWFTLSREARTERRPRQHPCSIKVATSTQQRGTTVPGRATRAAARCSSWPRRRRATLGPRRCLPACRTADKPMPPWWSLGTGCSTARRFTLARRTSVRFSPWCLNPDEMWQPDSAF